MINTITELYVDDAWVDITDDVYTRGEISIARGKANESSQAAPSRLELTLNNRDGKYSPRNPLSPYFGKIGRNTPIRSGLASSAYYSSGSTDDVRTPDSAPLSITGDLDVRIDLEMTGSSRWDAAIQYDLCGKANSGTTRSWIFGVANGILQLQWSVAGSTLITKQATVALPGPNTGRKAVRATLDVNNGAAGNTVTFYYSDSIDGIWTQLGDPVVTAGTTSIFDSTSSTYVNEMGGSSGFSPICYVYAVEIRNGIGGTVVAGPDFTEATPGAASYTDPQGNVWTLNSGAVFIRTVSGANIRMWGEVSSFPTKWELSGKDAWVPIEAAGLLRRLGQGAEPVSASLRDYILSQTQTLSSYYPLSGGEETIYSLSLGPQGAQFYPQPISGQNPVFKYGVDMGAPWLGTGMELNATGNAYMRGGGGTHANSSVAFDFVFQAITPGLGVLTIQLEDYNDNMWNLVLNNEDDDGTLQVSFDDPDVGPIGFLAAGPFTELQDTRLHHLRFQIENNGTDTDYSVYIDGDLIDDGTMEDYNVAGNRIFRLFYTRYVNQTVMNIAHLTLWETSDPSFIPSIDDVVEAAFGYAGETSGDRIERVAELANIPMNIVGDNSDTMAMGTQYEESTLAKIREAEGTDFGILAEPRDSFGLMYRTRASLYNQTPKATIDYSAGELSPPFEPVDDDQLTRNDVTVTKRDAGSFRVTIDEGPLSTQEPPDGVGRYQDSVEVNTETQSQLPSIASWLAHIGTLDEARYPSITVNLAAPDVASDPDLVAALLSVDIGDVIVITNASSVNIYDDVRALVLGYSETIGPVEHKITFNCAPASPYDVAVYDTSKYDTAGSELASGVTSTATALSVTETGGTLWTTDDAAFPFDIRVGGERMTVTDISSTTSPQSFTVTRSVNGVVKAHSAGADVRLWNTPRYAL